MAKSNENTNVANTETVKKEKKERAKTSVKFVGPSGELHLVTYRIAPSNIQTYAVWIRPTTEKNRSGKVKKERKRGASETHKDIAAANAAIEKLMAEVAKRGWTKKAARSGGFQSKPDAFDLNHLPLASSPSPTPVVTARPIPAKK